MSKPNFWQELKRRNVYRVAVTYTMIAWILIQVASILLPTFEAPNWVMQLAIILLIIGFPVALILAWIYELTPSGIVKTSDIDDEEPAESGSVRKPFISNVFIGILLVALIGQFIYFKWLTKDTSTEDVISTTLKTERIAIVPFENLTNDPSRENFGKIAANFINLALMDVEDAEVVSPSTVQSNLSAVGILPDDPSDRTSFRELTGATLVIAGNYFMKDDQLTLALLLQDTKTGKMRFALPHITGEGEEIEAIISDARDDVLGYWVAKDLIDSRRIKLPDVKAYGLFLDRSEVGFSYERLEEILTLDSSFYLARIEWLNHARWLVHDSKPGHFQFLQRHLSDLTQYERTLFDYVKNLYTGNSIATFNTIHSLWERFPRDYGLNHDAAGIAFDELNNHELSLQIYDELPFAGFDDRTIQKWSGRIRNEIVSRSIFNGPDALHSSPLLQKINDIEWDEFYGNFLPSLYAIMTGDEESYTDILNRDLDQLKSPDSKFQRLRNRFAWDCRSTFSSDKMNEQFISKIKQLLSQHTEGGLDREILNLIVQVNDNQVPPNRNKIPPEGNLFDPFSPYHRYLYWLALSKIQTGDTKEVISIIDQLESYIAKDLTLAASYAAFPYYHIGCIYAQMGDSDNALKYLKRARDMGLYAGHYQFNYDKHLKSLTENPEFKKLVAPVRPE